MGCGAGNGNRQGEGWPISRRGAVRGLERGECDMPYPGGIWMGVTKVSRGDIRLPVPSVESQTDNRSGVQYKRSMQETCDAHGVYARIDASAGYP